MSNLDELCNEVQSLSSEKKLKLLINCINTCVTLIKKEGFSEKEALTTVINTVCCAAAADGRFAADEYPYIGVLLDNLSGKDYSYEQCKQTINYLRGSGNFERDTTKLIKDFGKLNNDLKLNLIKLCLLICSVDGEISDDEKTFLLNLF